ncbi:mechanosensitive ion channel family protein [Pseudohoeflea coraliihabitans]|uniref:Small-conductance mechanosensitive channel n=1 Tax=Pseudohoeflea coraliihabitans TaxID=2860393 RepID=A0ABS6WJR4_9HYPH|nr:mechanosensitive ion channel family protein [Pseudohoeflea sp. DP4N28-3]MBW3096005.1 mechanosensitive ion channel [Pseudohoeflea sp. DP4N28-3]
MARTSQLDGVESFSPSDILGKSFRKQGRQMVLPAIGLTRASIFPRLRLAVLAMLFFVVLLFVPAQPHAQPADEASSPEQAVAVEPVARDEVIENRIGRILRATGWYRNVLVDVDEGIVFIDGIAGSQDQRDWARDLAARTEGTVAVVNRIEVREEVNWDFAPAFGEIESLARKFAVSLPLIVLAVLILPLAWLLSSMIATLVRRVLAQRIEQDFLRNVIARAIAIPILVLGVYLVLQVAGLTGLAVSLLGGAGVIGIVIGFAFRDIAENFLASLLLSIRRPFRQGDVIGVADFEGVVQSMNTRSTILLTLEGNHVQIPNATVFKNTIVNYTAGPARRITAEVGIGYDTSIGETQRLIVDVLRGHEAILNEPPPMVLVDALGSATVNLKAHFWIDGRSLSPHRVRSSALRLIKRTLVENGVSMPDEAREVIFPQGLPVVVMDGADKDTPPGTQTAIADATRKRLTVVESGTESTAPEGGLGNEINELPEDIADATIPEAASENLLSRR